VSVEARAVRRRKPFTARVVKQFAPLRETPHGRLDVRVIETDHGRRLDVREFITSETFTGFTRKGICIDAEMFDALLEQADEIRRLLATGDRGDTA
jgi:hypothetical protein